MMTAIATNQLTLSELLKGFVNINNHDDCSIQGLCLDSRKVKTGDVFFALRGVANNPVGEVSQRIEAYIEQAISKGAVAVVWETESGASAIPVNYREVANGRRVPLIAITELATKLGFIADRFYQSPSKDLYVVGITGTNGKTSCSQYLAQALSHDTKCGVMGTLGAGVYGNLKETHYTTPDALHCHAWLAKMHDVGVSDISMEVSSHALDQGRVNGIEFDCAVFTNLSRDHLDYHGDLENYAQTKRLLFTMPSLKQVVVNVDDEFGRELVNRECATWQASGMQVIRYGLDKQNKPDVMAENLVLSEQGMQMFVSTPWGKGVLTAPLLGRFNASNLLAVLSVLLLKGISFNEALERLARLTAVAGRMQSLVVSGKPQVVVDYAHTPDALEHALSTLREHCHAELWCVFGCGGDRDRGKRAMMGSIATQYADHVVLTDDNPRTEKSEHIIADILQGIAAKENLIIETNRDQAIKYAITHAKQHDIVLIAGKGHEDYQIIGEHKVSFSDVKQARKYLGIA